MKNGVTAIRAKYAQNELYHTKPVFMALGNAKPTSRIWSHRPSSWGFTGKLGSVNLK